MTAGGDVDRHGREPRRDRRDAARRRRTRATSRSSISLAFNSLGWNSQNILFNLVDTILGDPLIAAALDGEDPSLVSATITNSTIDAGGDVNVIADRRDAAERDGLERRRLDRVGAVQRDGQGDRPRRSRRTRSRARRYAAIEDSDVTAGGDLTVRASRRGRHLVEHQDRLLVADDERRRRRRPAGRDQQLHRRRQVPLQRRAAGPRARRHGPHPRRPGDGRRQEGRGLRVDGRGRSGRPERRRTTPTSACGGRSPRALPCRPGSNVTNSDSMGIGAAIVAQRRLERRRGRAAERRTDHRGQRHGRGDRVGDDRRDHRRHRLLRPAAPASPATASRSRPAASSPRTACRARARAIVDETPIETTAGDVTVAAHERLADRGDEPRRDAVGLRSRSRSLLAFNTVGWGRSNLLFAAVDALLGDPLISDGVRRQPAPGRGARVGHEQPDHLGRRRLGDGDVDGADPRACSRTTPPRRRRRSWAPAA